MIQRVPPGWAATEPGYFMADDAMREFATAAFTYEAESLLWQKAYHELSEQARARALALQGELSALRRDLDLERAQWRGALRKARSPGFGVFAGVGYSAGGEINAVVGVGVVWKIF